MIHISRDGKGTDGKLFRPDDAWFILSTQSTEKAKEEGSRHSIDESVYHKDSLKQALKDLFHKKCAYCETQLSETDWQVEHFRPKRRVAERPDHHGYYWLAYTWENLYPSCITCNQRRKVKPNPDDPATGKTTGKADQFPVEDEAFRVMNPDGDLSTERPLLLDPCVDDPEKRFRYLTNGEIAARDDVDSRAAKTISVFGFEHRSDLTKRRREQISIVIGLLKILRRCKELGDQVGAGDVERLLEEHYFADSSPYLGAVRFIRNDPDAFAAPPGAAGSSLAA